MLHGLIIAIGVVAASGSAAHANTPEAGLRTAVSACEAWLLEPSTWAGGIHGFPARAKLSGLQAQSVVPHFALPPAQMRKNLHSWRVPVGEGGYFVTTSDTLPLCHVAGGGPIDFEPGVEALLASAPFMTRWNSIGRQARADLISSQFVSKADPALKMILTRASRPGARTDRAQLVATVTYEIQK